MVKTKIAKDLPEILNQVLGDEKTDLSGLSELELLEITKAAFVADDLNSDELAHVFNRVLLAKKAPDMSIDQNLGLLAARAGLNREAKAFALDFLDSGHPKVAVAIARNAIKNSNPEDKSVFESIIRDASATGHVQSRISNAELRLRKLDFFGAPLLFLYKLAILPSVFVAVMRNPNDRRLK